MTKFRNRFHLQLFFFLSMVFIILDVLLQLKIINLTSFIKSLILSFDKTFCQTQRSVVVTGPITIHGSVSQVVVALTTPSSHAVFPKVMVMLFVVLIKSIMPWNMWKHVTIITPLCYWNGGEVIVILFVKSIIAMQHVETCGIVRPRDWQFTCW